MGPVVARDVGVAIGCVGVATVAFALMAVVAHRFVPVLCKISASWKIPANVAGATLMAAGASSPELFSNIISVYITKSDIGVGTIIGSEIFNHMIILAGVAWARDGPQRLDPLTSLRDTGAYLAALCVLLVAVSDVHRHASTDDEINAVVVVRSATTVPLPLVYAVYVFFCGDLGRLALSRCFGPYVPAYTKDEEIIPLTTVKEERRPPDEDDEEDLDAWTRAPACVLPVLATIPASMPYLAALSCVVWMTGLSYAMVVSLERAADFCGASTSVVGLTVGAIGTSLPNLVSSTTAAKRGLADMAVSNALGSNVFNICIALGGPWLFYPVVHRGHAYSNMHDDAVDVLALFLVAVLLAYMLLNVITKYTLYPQFAFYFVAIYAAFLLTALLAHNTFRSIENREQGGH
ncbi:hypothetical protein CTAYLR_008812 [Chrysophaeum taylorii]|uniref:Sodium/calcium exchanger membrane region domain-containing protein n=1 Tax=Chrysophaeum taylorii TaxID=2483200 RepID=A0AAD7UBZ9_9STRA|nr:hypothetical protein CTAYLR_008812 [Chrysophaeum taylorii]